MDSLSRLQYQHGSLDVRSKNHSGDCCHYYTMRYMLAKLLTVVGTISQQDRLETTSSHLHDKIICSCAIY